jgi:vacuolar-type H+-ATPase subunit H
MLTKEQILQNIVNDLKQKNAKLREHREKEAQRKARAAVMEARRVAKNINAGKFPTLADALAKAGVK